MEKKIFYSTFWTMFVVLGLIAFGCSSNDSGKLLQEVSGVWQRSQGSGTVQVNLTGKTKTLVVDGQSYSAKIDKVKMDSYEVDLKVQNGSAQPEMWSIRQVWDDTGEHYKLVFNHNGTNEDLPQKASS
jgi:hypothetical protein